MKSMRSTRRVGLATPERLLAEQIEARYQSVYAFLARRCRDRDVAEDLTQETLERALRNWRRFDPSKGSLEGWLFQIARQVSIDYARTSRRQTLHEQAWHATEPRIVPPPAEPAELPASVAAAWDRLTPDDRTLVTLRVILGWPTREVADVLGISVTNCSTRLSRILHTLRSEAMQPLSKNEMPIPHARLEALLDHRAEAATKAEREILWIVDAVRGACVSGRGTLIQSPPFLTNLRLNQAILPASSPAPGGAERSVRPSR
jgi:RNA polymerase sigma-70 factor (ECF subfamily)